MQKIDLYQNIIHSFLEDTTKFNTQQATKDNAGWLPEYKKADLQVMFAIIQPYTKKINPDGSILYTQSNKELSEYWKAYEKLRKENNIILIKEWRQVGDTKYMDFGLNFIYHLAGGDGIKSVDDLQKIYDAGFRSIQLVFQTDNALAHCYKTPEGGLTELGKDVIVWMDKHKMIIDTANMNYQSMADVYKYTKKPIMNSHTNLLSTYKDGKNITDDFLQLIFQSNGIIGLSLSSAAISGTDEWATIDNYLDQIQYVRDKIGDDNVALWSWYHNFTFKQLITWYEAVGSLALLEQKMTERFWYKFTYRFFWENPYRFIMETL